MISKDFKFSCFIESIEDMSYHEVFTTTLKESYASTDILAHMRRDKASENEIQALLEYHKALQDVIFLLQTGQRPDYVTKSEVDNYNQFKRVAEKLVLKGELLPEILKFFD